MALMIVCIWHGLDALQGTRAKPGNHLVLYKCMYDVLQTAFICLSIPASESSTMPMFPTKCDGATT